MAATTWALTGGELGDDGVGHGHGLFQLLDILGLGGDQRGTGGLQDVPLDVEVGESVVGHHDAHGISRGMGIGKRKPHGPARPVRLVP